jgi:hypothetical protein
VIALSFFNSHLVYLALRQSTYRTSRDRGSSEVPPNLHHFGREVAPTIRWPASCVGQLYWQPWMSRGLLPTSSGWSACSRRQTRDRCAQAISRPQTEDTTREWQTVRGSGSGSILACVAGLRLRYSSCRRGRAKQAVSYCSSLKRIHSQRGLRRAVR